MRDLDCHRVLRSAFLAVCVVAIRPMAEVQAQTVNVTAASKENSAAKTPAAATATVEKNPVTGEKNPIADGAKPAAKPVDQFQELLDRAIEVTSRRYLTANSHSPWQIFHYLLAMRQEAMLRLGKEKVNALEWLSTTEPKFDNQPWLLLTPHGAKFHPYTKMYFFEGHPSQFLALLSHSDLPMDYPFHVQGKVLTLADLVNNTMKEVNTKEEVTWVLWALQHFLNSDATWVNQANEPWSIERLVEIESAAPVVGAPCGGNHRLFALTRARDKYLKSGGTLRGVWFQADQKIKQHIEIARSLQNPDGSFSADWYKGAQFTNDVNKRFNTTGHTMEFLSASLPKERLNEKWVRDAVWMLSRELVIHQNTQIDCGPLFHSLDALILYRDRIRQKATTAPGAKPLELASKPLQTATDTVSKAKPEEKTTPDASVNRNPSPMPPEVTSPPPNAKPLESKPTDILKPQAKPTDEKSSDSVVSPPAISIPNPLAIPDSKTVEPKVESSVKEKTQSEKSKTDLSVSRHDLKDARLPRIDPAKLSNIGQVAPTARLDDPSATASRTPRREASLTAPALLPDLAATPLAKATEGLGRQTQPVPAVQSTDAHASTETVLREPLPAAACEDQEPCDAATAIGQPPEAPVSALEPSNPE